MAAMGDYNWETKLSEADKRERALSAKIGRIESRLAEAELLLSLVQPLATQRLGEKIYHFLRAGVREDTT